MSTRFCGEVEEVVTDHSTSGNSDPHLDGDKPSTKGNDARLQDIEEQLEMAESRCNNLKDQLDHMKQIYGNNRNLPSISRKMLGMKNPDKISGEEIPTSHESFRKAFPVTVIKSRQKSDHIGTDNSGAAVRTINNILNGITNSVNRLSEIHSQIVTPRPKVSTGISPSPQANNVPEVKRGAVGIVPEIQLESTSTLLPQRVKIQKRKVTKNIKTSSQHTIKKPSRSDKKIKSIVAKSSAGLEKKSSTTMKSRFLSKFNSKNNNLVEIYHNDAVKHSDSDESNVKKSRQCRERQMNDEINGEEADEVPPLNINLLNPLKEVHHEQVVKSGPECPNGFKNHYIYDPPFAPRTTMSCCYSKNYELPTVASKMKQVARTYLGSLNLKTIPFCAAISTTQSHNIGINIQQVMNIIKNKQPINGISPTLAHNIGLAADKLNNKHFSTLVSTINSRISQTASKCPLSRTYLNIQQLQEQAKTIPEETIEECDEETADSPDTRTMIITGPSGDMEIKTKNVPSWRADKPTTADQCTCIVQPNVDFQQVADKYQRNIRTITENTLNSQLSENQLKHRLRRYKTTRNSKRLPQSPVAQDTQVQTTTAINQETQKEDTLNGREKDLKAVLTNLHQDFDSLNRKYDELSQKQQTEGNDYLMKDLEKLEVELNKKEEEITMVMTLYKEVLALKQQIRQLKERRSHASLPNKETKDTKIKFKEYNNPEAAFHLTKLLKQIQHYQMRYKTNLSQE